MSAPPRMAPAMLPDPPITTPASTRMENWSWKVAELMKPCSPAKSTPPKPPMQAPIANAHSLYLTVRTPMISAASSSSRMASQDRPTRLRDGGEPPVAAQGLRAVGGDPDDLGEAEGHDRQIVATQPQRRPAEDETAEHRACDCDRDGGDADPLRAQDTVGRAEQCHRVRADREEADVAEVEQPGEPDHHVETEREEHVVGHVEEGTRPVDALGDQLRAENRDVGEVRQQVAAEHGEGDEQPPDRLGLVAEPAANAAARLLRLWRPGRGALRSAGGGRHALALPRNAPRRLPIPPSTAAVNASTPR